MRFCCCLQVELVEVTHTAADTLPDPRPPPTAPEAEEVRR
jgi:hypothetical protein